MHAIIRHWLTSLKHYLLMCLFLSSPERLPYNLYCTALTIIAYLALGLWLVDAEHSYAVILSQNLFELSMLGLIAWLGLRWKKFPQRFTQTFSALVGVNLVINAIAIPIYDALADVGGDPRGPLLYATLAMLVWNLAALSLIFKRAFEISTHLSAMISFNFFVVYQFTTIWFY